MRVSVYTLYFQKLESLAYIFVAACMGLPSIFIQICAVGYKRRTFSAPDCALAVQGRSGSSNVDDFGTNRKRVYDFLLVGHCDYGSILHRFRDMMTYWLKWPIFATFLLPLSHSAPSFPMFPLEFRAEVNQEQGRP